MKTSKIILMLLLFCITQSNLMAQIQKQDWRKINRQLKQSKSSEQLKSINQGNLSIKVEENKSSYFLFMDSKLNQNLSAVSKGENAVEISFEEDKRNLMFSLLKFSWMISSSESLNKKPSLTITGFSSANEMVYPVVSTNEDEKISIEDGKLSFDNALASNIQIAFPKSINRIRIHTQIDPKATSVLELSPIFWVKGSIIPNPPISINDCNAINIKVLMDQSSSMSKEEKENLRIGLIYFMEEEIIGESIKANIAFIEFDRLSNIGTGYLEVTKENISANGGAIYDYLFREYGKTKYTKQNWTNWEGAFKLAANMNRETPAHLLIFTTDGLPNGSVNDPLIAPESLEKTIQYTNQIKEAGTHIFAIANSEFKEENAAFWFGLLTNDQNSKTTDIEENNDINSDFFVVNSFQEIPTSLINAFAECDPKYTIDLTAKLVSNKRNRLSWKAQVGLNKDQYSIYRSTDKADWIRLSGDIQANEKELIFYDNAPNQGRNYYQVKATRENNTAISSSIRLIKIKTKEFIKLFPNPARGNVDIILSKDLLKSGGNFSIAVRDILGKTLDTQIQETESGFHLNTETMQGGTYLIDLKNNGDIIHTDKLVIIH